MEARTLSSSYSSIEDAGSGADAEVVVSMSAEESVQDAPSQAGPDADESKSLRFRALRAYDVQVNGAVTSFELRRFALFSVLMVVVAPLLFWLIVELMPEQGPCGSQGHQGSQSSHGSQSSSGSFSVEQCRRINLLGNVALMLGLFLLLGVGAGVLSLKTSINVGYTRKTLHFASFFLPFAVNELVPLHSHWGVTLLKFWLVMLVYLLACKPARRWLWPALVVFRAIDRPDDRPDTLKWLVTQFLSSSLVVLALNALWDNWQRTAAHTDELVLVLVLINGLGDGLAEPVGVRLGGKVFSRIPWLGGRLGKYRVRAWRHNGQCCSGEYTRSWEGSSVVYLVALCALLALNEAFTHWQWVVALLGMPPLMSLTEARSPRTWDSPFLFLIGGILLSLVILLPI